MASRAAFALVLLSLLDHLGAARHQRKLGHKVDTLAAGFSKGGTPARAPGASGSPLLHVTVVNMAGVAAEMDVGPAATVRDVKRGVQEQKGIPWWEQCLVSGLTILEDSQALSAVVAPGGEDREVQLSLVVRRDFDFMFEWDGLVRRVLAYEKTGEEAAQGGSQYEQVGEYYSQDYIMDDARGKPDRKSKGSVDEHSYQPDARCNTACGATGFGEVQFRTSSDLSVEVWSARRDAPVPPGMSAGFAPNTCGLCSERYEDVGFDAFKASEEFGLWCELQLCTVADP